MCHGISGLPGKHGRHFHNTIREDDLDTLLNNHLVELGSRIGFF
jgi:hypothetical protein